MPDRWEYLRSTIFDLNEYGGGDTARGLDRAGAEGWELIAVTPDELYVFKRRVVPDSRLPGVGGGRSFTVDNRTDVGPPSGSKVVEGPDGVTITPPDPDSTVPKWPEAPLPEWMADPDKALRVEAKARAGAAELGLNPDTDVYWFSPQDVEWVGDDPIVHVHAGSPAQQQFP